MSMFFKLKSEVGNHRQKNKEGQEITYCSKDGSIIESEVDLVKMFPDKFDRIDTGVVSVPVKEVKKEKAINPVVTVSAPPILKVEMEPEKKEVKSEKKEKPLGKDVTVKFPTAQEQDFKVFYVKGSGYFVTEADDVSTGLNKKGLKKDGIAPFIEKYLEG